MSEIVRTVGRLYVRVPRRESPSGFLLVPHDTEALVLRRWTSRVDQLKLVQIRTEQGDITCAESRVATP